MSTTVPTSGSDSQGLESLILRLSNEFINLPVEELDRKILETVETLARFADAVRGSVFLLSDDGQSITNTHEWCLDPADSQKDLLQGIPFEHFGYYAGLLRRFSTVTIGAPDDLPPEAVGERSWATQHGFRALLFVPMRLTGRLVGALGFYGRVGENRVWPGKYAHLLEFAAVAIVNALERRRHEDERRELREMARASHLLRVEQALRSTMERDAMLHRVLDVVCSTLGCQRALLLHPCDPGGPSWRVAVDCRISPPVDASPAAEEVAMEPEAARFLRELRAAGAPVRIGPDAELPLPVDLARRLQLHSGLAVGITTSRGEPWVLVVQRPGTASAWGTDERGLLQDIAWRIGDALEVVQTFQELRESQARFAAIFDYAPGMISSFDPEGRLHLWNHGCRARLGWTPEEIRDCDDPLALLLDSERERRRKRESLARADGTFQRYEMRARDGCTRIQLWADFRLPSGQVISVGHDITDEVRHEEERKEFDRKLLHTQKLESLGVLAGGIAHDFNNLLVGIVGYLDLAKGLVDPGSTAREHLLGAEQAALQLAELSRQMLAYSGKGAFVVEPVDISGLVEGMQPILAASVDKKAVLEFQLMQGLPSVIADPTQLRQVVLNLVLNASEALDGRTGRILVSTGSIACDRDYLRSTYVDDGLLEGDYVFLDVSDNGQGMSAETSARIFEPFYSTKFAGRGLGLAAALGIARGHKGAFEVKSELGRGSTFRLLLPASAATPARPAPGRTSEWRGHGVVLLADDEPFVRDVARRMIEGLGFDVVMASDGLQAVELFGRHRDEIVVVILDVTMPALGGREALERIRGIDPDVAVVLSSGYACSEVTDERATAFLQKPFTTAEIEAVLRPLV